MVKWAHDGVSRGFPVHGWCIAGGMLPASGDIPDHEIGDEEAYRVV